MLLTEERNDQYGLFSNQAALEQFIGDTVKKAIRDEMPTRRSSQTNTSLIPSPNQSTNNLVPIYSSRQSFTQMNAVLETIEASPLVKKKKVDPLVFDLTGQGVIKTTSMKKVFNITGKGNSITGWVDKGMGLLAFDVDNNNTQGKDGRSLLGNFTPIDGKTYKNGFEALKALAQKYIFMFNRNYLGYLDLKTLEYKAGLCMLVDGKKLKLTDDLKITQISLEYEELGQNPDKFGNQHRQRSWFVRNGKKQLVVDVWFKYTSPVDMPKGKEVMKKIQDINYLMKIANTLGY